MEEKERMVIMSNKNEVGDIIREGKRSGDIKKVGELGVGSNIFDVRGRYGVSSNSWCTIIRKREGEVLIRLKSGEEK